MKIIKVINNNTVSVIDDKGKEQIISGKGIGFGKKYGDEPDKDKIQKMYLVTDSELRKRLIECLTEIPYEHIKLTADLVDYISSHIDGQLNESLIITLSDHISFAIERKKQGLEFENPLMDAISDCFPKELALGRYCVAEIYQRLGVELRGDEGTKMEQIQDITKMVNSCAEIADACLAGKINKNSVAYERFLVHLKYLAKRLFKSQELPNVLSRDEEFADIIKKKFKKQYKCAKHMQDHILKNYAKTISEDEMITLSIHLKKISG